MREAKMWWVAEDAGGGRWNVPRAAIGVVERKFGRQTRSKMSVTDLFIGGGECGRSELASGDPPEDFLL